MVTAIQQAIHPLFLTFRIFGLGIHTLGKPYFNIFYNVTLWISYGCLYYYVVIGLKVEKWFQIGIHQINVAMNLIVVIISIFSSSYQYKRMWIFLKRLDTIDNTLEELGTPKTYQKLHIRIKGIIIGWLVCTQTGNIVDMIWWLHTIPENFWYIGTKFDELNEHMRYLLLREEYNTRYTRKKILQPTRYIMCVNNYKRLLWTTM
ncbi:PREDICTED: uncharacterized protein LOC105460841 [Wasmannia auropunctata]|uniref:uncharacterized protein LOC105460841 n=1 Tax=Wasmannia auropunctata TaxID=64793 RepID=UPI0005F0BD34|nr:PREDICTED: uncharacterized protein LOC105460841 [Wasmannia auropunctata]